MYGRAHWHSEFPLLPNSNQTRSSLKIRFDIPIPKSEKFKKFPHYYGTQLWNALPALTQTTLSYTHFKSLVKPAFTSPSPT